MPSNRLRKDMRSQASNPTNPMRDAIRPSCRLGTQRTQGFKIEGSLSSGIGLPDWHLGEVMTYDIMHFIIYHKRRIMLHVLAPYYIACNHTVGQLITMPLLFYATPHFMTLGCTTFHFASSHLVTLQKLQSDTFCCIKRGYITLHSNI